MSDATTKGDIGSTQFDALVKQDITTQLLFYSSNSIMQLIWKVSKYAS
jgi:hypothetical protein